MEYFKLFDLPVQMDTDKKLLRAKYLELSRQFHPDYFANAGAAEQANALDASARLNKAFKVLGNREATIRYVLEEKGLLEQEEKFALSNDFLMEMMDFNEAVAELAFEPDPEQLEKIREQFNQIEEDIYAPVAPVVEHYQEGVTSEKELLQVKEYYFRKKYLDRLKQQLAGMQ